MPSDPPRWFRCSGAKVALQAIKVHGNGYRQVFPISVPCIEAELPLANPAVFWSSTVGQPCADVQTALVSTFFDADGGTAAIPSLYIVQALGMITPKWANELRVPRYARAFPDAMCKGLSDLYGIPLALPSRWMPCWSARNRKRRLAAMVCPLCDPGQTRTLYGTGIILLCKEHWRHAEGWVRPKNCITAETIKRANNSTMCRPQPGMAVSVQKLLLSFFGDDMFDLMAAVFSDIRFDIAYNTPNVRAHTILCWMHPETSDKELPAHVWATLYRWNTARAASIVQIKTQKPPRAITGWTRGNKDLQVTCCMALPRKQQMDAVAYVDDPEQDVQPSHDILFYATKSNLYVAAAVWFFHAVFVAGTVQLRLVLRAPDPDDTSGINALELRKMTPCADGVLRITNAEAVSFQMLHFLLWWNYRHKRIDEKNATVELRVSWLRARQCLHYKEQCVGPQAAGLVGYALRETCRSVLPSTVSVAIDPDYSILDYDGELADKARTELEIAQGCLGNDPDVLPALNEHCDHIKVVDELVDFVRNHPTKTTPPEPDATMPTLVSGNADDDDSEEEASQQLSQSKRIRSRSSSCFL